MTDPLTAEIVTRLLLAACDTIEDRAFVVEAFARHGIDVVMDPGPREILVWPHDLEHGYRVSVRPKPDRRSAP